MELKRSFLAIQQAEIKLSGEKAGTFSGYASVFGGVDSYGDTILPGAFAKALKDKEDSGRQIKMFFDHKWWEMPIGRWTKAAEDSKGLHVEGELTPGHSKANDVLAALKHGTLDGLSIGFYMGKDDYETIDNGKGRLIKSISDLVEVSVVTFPADDNARVDLSAVKSAVADLETIKDFERFLRDAGGFSKAAATALVARAKELFGRGDPETIISIDAKAASELTDLFAKFQVPAKLDL